MTGDVHENTTGSSSDQPTGTSPRLADTSDQRIRSDHAAITSDRPAGSSAKGLFPGTKGCATGTGPIRDPDLERRFLTASAPHDVDWPTLVADRLDTGQRLYGNRWTTQPLTDLIREIDEEALDIAAWSVLAAQALDHADLRHSDRERVAHVLARAAREAAQIHTRLRTAHLFAQPPRARMEPR